MPAPGPLKHLLGSLAIIVAATALAGCGSSSSDATSTVTAPAPTANAGSPGATSSNVPAGIQAKTCVEKNLDPPKVVVTGGPCSLAQSTVAAWQGKASCHLPEGASRYACTVPGKLRCLGAATARGISVTCSSPKVAIAFTGRND